MNNPIYDKVIAMSDDPQHALRVHTEAFRTYPGGTRSDDNYCESKIIISFENTCTTLTKKSSHIIDGGVDASQNAFFCVNHGLSEGPKILRSCIEYRLDQWLKELSKTENGRYCLHTNELWYNGEKYTLSDIFDIIENALQNKESYFVNEIANTFIDKAIEESRFMRFSWLGRLYSIDNNFELFIYANNDIGINIINPKHSVYTSIYIPNELISDEKGIDATIKFIVKKLEVYGVTEEYRWKVKDCDDERKELLSEHKYTLKEICDGIREGLTQLIKYGKEEEENED